MSDPFKLADVAPDLAGRVLNWKFQQAVRKINLLPGRISERPEVHHRLEIITSLAIVFGDSGWFDGEMGAVVGAAVNYVLGGTPEVKD